MRGHVKLAAVTVVVSVMGLWLGQNHAETGGPPAAPGAPAVDEAAPAAASNIARPRRERRADPGRGVDGEPALTHQEYNEARRTSDDAFSM